MAAASASSTSAPGGSYATHRVSGNVRRRKSAASAATPAPSEWPTHTTGRSACAARSSTSVGVTSLAVLNAMAAMPECARPATP